MAFEGHEGFPLTPAGILAGAPEESWVYAIHTPTRWVCIGDSDNLRQALFDHLNAPDELLESFQPRPAMQFGRHGAAVRSLHSRKIA